MDKRSAGCDELEIAFVELQREITQESDFDLNPSMAQLFDAPPAHARVRILDRDNRARDSCLDQRISARRRAAVVTTRLKLTIDSSATASVSGGFDCISLGVF